MRERLTCVEERRQKVFTGLEVSILGAKRRGEYKQKCEKVFQRMYENVREGSGMFGEVRGMLCGWRALSCGRRALPRLGLPGCGESRHNSS